MEKVLIDKINKLMPMMAGTYVKASIKSPEVVHDVALLGLAYILASDPPLAPMIKNKTPNKKMPTGIPNDSKCLFATIVHILSIIMLFLKTVVYVL